MKEVEEWQNTKASFSASLTESKDCFWWALAMVAFCFVVQLMVGLSQAKSKRASSTAAALASSTCYSTVDSCSLTHSCSSSRTSAGRVLSLRCTSRSAFT